LAWVVVDDAFGLHEHATTFLAGLRARDLSVNTERAYAGRVALYLRYCAERRPDWADPGFLGLTGFQNWLITDPLPARGPLSDAPPRVRSRGSANAVMTSVCEFLRFGFAHGWVPAGVVALLANPKLLRHLPAGFDAGENGQFRQVMRPAFRFTEVERGYEAFSDDQIERVLNLTRHARDRFLVLLLLLTGMRIGEALGLRREDMHLLANSTALGCSIEGPHMHVRRRRDNANGALAKSRFPRAIPVTADLVGAYTEYRYERDNIPAATGRDMVLVNLFRAPLGAPVTYSATKDLFDRLARAAGFPVRPHMLRHTAATRWVRAGVDRDVVQHLLGHASSASLQPYLHAKEQDKRDAVERVAAARAVLR
jgi:integrase